MSNAFYDDNGDLQLAMATQGFVEGSYISRDWSFIKPKLNYY